MTNKTTIDPEKLKAILQAHKINTAKQLVREIDKNPELQKKINIVVGTGSWVRDSQSKSNDWDIICILDDSGDDITKIPIMFILDSMRSLLQQIAWGVDQRFHIQVYTLTTLIDGTIQAAPTIYSYVRDGIPFKDEKGLFITLKRMVETSKIKPTYDTIETEQRIARERINKIKDQINGTLFFELQYAAADISQAVSAAWGYEMPDPVRIEGILKEMKAQGVIEQKYIDIWVDVRKKWKGLEHKVCFEVSPQEFGEYERKVREYIDYMESKIVGGQRFKQKQDASKYISQIKDQVKQILNLLNVDYTDENALVVFEKEVVDKKRISPQILNILKQFIVIQENFDKQREVSETEIRDAFGLINIVTNHLYTLKEHIKANTIDSIPHITLINTQGEIIEKLWFLKTDIIISKKEDIYFIAPISKPEDIALKPIKGELLLKKISGVVETNLPKEALLKRIKNAKDVMKIMFVAKNSVVINISELIK